MERARRLIGVALLWLLATAVSGGEPAAKSGYVLLRDLAVLRGTVEEEAGQIIIRDEGAEIRLPRDRVACWADSLDGLYQYQLDRRRVFTVESHLDAARWCLRHGLHARAEAEIVAAGRLQPDHPEVERSRTKLRLAIEREVALNAPPSPRESEPAAPAEGTQAEEASADADEVDQLRRVNDDQLRDFTVRIQPLLANRCSAAGCHGGGSAATWILQDHSLPGRRPTATTTRQNLAAVLRWIHREQPSASPLLVRALEPHGGAHAAPLGPGDRAAIENLREWILALPQQGSPLAGEHPQSVSESPQFASRGEPQMPSLEPSVGQGTQPVRLPDVADPFDPDLFNRRFHPETR